MSSPLAKFFPTAFVNNNNNNNTSSNDNTNRPSTKDLNNIIHTTLLPAPTQHLYIYRSIQFHTHTYVEICIHT